MMLMVIVGFLTSEMLGDFWKQKVPVNSRNWYDVIFRMVEVGKLNFVQLFFKHTKSIFK